MRSWKQKNRDKVLARESVSLKSSDHLKKAHNVITNILAYRKLNKLYTTYIKGIRDSTIYNGRNKIFCDFKQDGTVTGRLSCAGYKVGKHKKGVSFHTLPRESKLRTVCEAPPGWVFITTDQSQMELRTIAHLSREDRMINAFLRKEDLHTYSASLTFNVGLDKVVSLQRQIAKAVSFLIIYGGTEATLATNHNIPIKRAKKIIDSWYNAFPRIPEYMNFIENYIRVNGHVYTLFGRRRNLLNINSPNHKIVKAAIRQGINTTVQSAASDILLCSMLYIYEEFSRYNLLARIVACVHDSLEIICPFEEIEQVRAIINCGMLENPILKEKFKIDFSVPFSIETIYGKVFGEGLTVVDDEEVDYRAVKELISV